MKTSVHSAIAFVLVSLPVSCVFGQQPAVGVWTLWSIDGLPVENLLPSQSAGPAVELDGHQYAAGDIRWETRILSRRLQLLPGGDFREDETTVHTYILSPAVIQHVTGIRSTQARRIEQEAEEQSSLGTWRIEGDSLFLERDLDAIVGELLRVIVDLDPNANLESLRASVATILRESLPDSEKLVAYRGVWTEERLTIVDVNGRTLVFRR